MSEQRCGSCGAIKPIAEFNFRNRFLGTRHTTCKSCQRTFKRAHYARNLETYKITSAKQKVEGMQRNRERVRSYLLTHPCVDCGETDVIVLQFDHVRGKHKAISQLIIDGASWERIEREIAKCDVRCANCHRKRRRENAAGLNFRACSSMVRAAPSSTLVLLLRNQQIECGQIRGSRAR